VDTSGYVVMPRSIGVIYSTLGGDIIQTVMRI